MKAYIQPAMQTHAIKTLNIICQSLTQTSSNAGLSYGGGSTNAARAPQRTNDYWGEWEE